MRKGRGRGWRREESQKRCIVAEPAPRYHVTSMSRSNHFGCTHPASQPGEGPRREACTSAVEAEGQRRTYDAVDTGRGGVGGQRRNRAPEHLGRWRFCDNLFIPSGPGLITIPFPLTSLHRWLVGVPLTQLAPLQPTNRNHAAPPDLGCFAPCWYAF